VHDLPPASRLPLLKASAYGEAGGGRIYDAYAEVARAAGATVAVTDRRHFLASPRHGIRVETPAEFVAGLKTRR
jgi:hypothetical protein